MEVQFHHTRPKNRTLKVEGRRRGTKVSLKFSTNVTTPTSRLISDFQVGFFSKLVSTNDLSFDPGRILVREASVLKSDRRPGRILPRGTSYSSGTGVLGS